MSNVSSEVDRWWLTGMVGLSVLQEHISPPSATGVASRAQLCSCLGTYGPPRCGPERPLTRPQTNTSSSEFLYTPPLILP